MDNLEHLSTFDPVLVYPIPYPAPNFLRSGSQFALVLGTKPESQNPAPKVRVGVAVIRLPGLNQTYNVGVNYCYRGEGATLEVSDLGPCYVAAVGASCAMVYFGQRLVPKVRWLIGS